MPLPFQNSPLYKSRDLCRYVSFYSRQLMVLSNPDFRFAHLRESGGVCWCCFFLGGDIFVTFSLISLPFCHLLIADDVRKFDV